MNTALPYYKRWLKKFPDIKTLAQSDIREVLKAWQGLGYYSRARNLHTTAKLIHEKHDSQFPSDFETIHSFKGIGRYTAGAIASIAFNQEKPIVDGNVLRVLSRLYAIDKPIDIEKYREEFWDLQEKLIPKGKARLFNQAMMELGALICTPSTPACALCPLNQYCKAYKADRAADFPVKAKKVKIVKITAAAVVIENNGKYFIEKRPLGEIMGGLWEFPEWKLTKNKPLTQAQVEKKIPGLFEKKFSFQPAPLQYLGTIRRSYTYFNETLLVFKIKQSAMALAAAVTWDSKWVTHKDFSKYPFSSAHAKITKLITEK